MVMSVLSEIKALAVIMTDFSNVIVVIKLFLLF